ncbi:hypothetical protein [Sediminibacillus massiliensis]|uniref:hypothetical protein n=1 Tax=Sediminibacillus massiliensis TaxID=1926277 RepID=UPI0009884DDD|nr:hypothetical protein [Sediminibacillus massiliensis]
MIKHTRGAYDGVMSYNAAKEFVKEEGMEGFLDLLRSEYPNRDLYGCSTYWERDSQYICKARGKYGDVVIGWEK